MREKYLNGWLYIIKNGDLYKIGITTNLDNRMRQLKPDCILAKLYTKDFRYLEKKLHKKYKDVRIPQTEYFRLDSIQLREIKQIISKFYYPCSINFEILINSLALTLLLFLSVLFLIKLTINDIDDVLFITLVWMERLLFWISFLNLFFKSNKYLSLFNELRYRVSKFSILFIFALIFRFANRVLY